MNDPWHSALIDCRVRCSQTEQHNRQRVCYTMCIQILCTSGLSPAWLNVFVLRVVKMCVWLALCVLPRFYADNKRRAR